MKTDASTSYISYTCNVCTNMLFLLISIICPYVNVYVLWSVFQQELSEYICKYRGFNNTF